MVPVFSGSTPPSGPYHKVIRDVPAVCAQASFSDGPLDSVVLSVTCGSGKGQSRSLTVNEVEPWVFKLDNTSQHDHILFIDFQNLFCQGKVALLDDDLSEFQYDGCTQTMKTAFEGDPLFLISTNDLPEDHLQYLSHDSRSQTPIFGRPYPPAGSYHKVIAQQPIVICAQINWTNDPDMGIEVAALCGLGMSTSDDLYLDELPLLAYKVDPVSEYKHTDFIRTINSFCNGTVALLSDDMFKFEYHISEQTIETKFRPQGVEYNLTFGLCF
ncbi:hypothetical protein FOZ61_004040 [Perkinsus olseni]|uniref:Uncharacterized protein n=1 Tax=Perkinsus olseni TaxID=32597 RepID=A0A7J6LMJ1_PEROL|nr:hypothetical protein FOZ61_004040 [Perkinsus olseni]